MNSPIREKQALRDVVDRLAKLLNAGSSTLRIPPAPGPDAIIELAGHTFLLEWRQSSAAAPMAAAIEQLLEHRKDAPESAIPLIAVPFMGQVGSARCREAGVFWLDLSGNAHIEAEGLRIIVKGEQNRFKSRGRPSSAFAPKSSRIARWLLIHHGAGVSQRKIAKETGVGEGFTSRIIQKLKDQQLVEGGGRSGLRVPNPDLLLDAWHEHYDFHKHLVIQGHVTARSGDELLHKLIGSLAKENIPYAVSGLAAAWNYTRFASFRLSTIYLRQTPSPALLKDLGFREDPRGANVWFALPNDDGVFHGAKNVDRITCVHPIQVYLDLKGHPERSEEAAEQIRAELLHWGASE